MTEERKFELGFVGEFSYRNDDVYFVMLDNEDEYHVVTSANNTMLYDDIDDAMTDFALSLFTCNGYEDEEYLLYKCPPDESMPENNIWICENRMRFHECYGMIRGFGSDPHDAIEDCHDAFCNILDQFLDGNENDEDL